MKKIGLLFVLCGGFAAVQAETFVGVVTDAMCGAKHDMVKGKSSSECIRMCVKSSSDYALFDGKNVLKLSDQKLPARFAAQRVKVTGTLEAKTNTIKVSSIESAK